MASFSLIANNAFFTSRLIDLIKLQRLRHASIYPAMDFHSLGPQDAANNHMPKWNKIDGRAFGITRSMIPSSSWTVLKILRDKGFEAYLVGGCVRDLLLNRVPKDFDVITTAGLEQIRKLFHRAHIVGRRFPICTVNIKGSITEVSSFETVAEHADGKERVTSSKTPKKCDKKDLIRWRNSMHRDFTINSLFFDPFLNKIYDYAEGIADLRSLKLRTLIPASLSFKEDCARILRGLRIAARLGLSLSKETETAMRELSPSITSLAKSRLMMELNYMLSYGAAVPSLYLLQRFNLLEMLLPFQAAYLDKQGIKKSSLSSIMLMKLFFNLDKLFSCDCPSDCNIWVALLAFHMALVNNPQNSLIVLAFAATLYHGDWNEGVNYARENSLLQINLRPEITSSAQFTSEEELTEGVTHFASKVQGCIAALTSADSLLEAMSTFPDSPCSSLVLVSNKTSKDVANIFEALVNDVESYKNKRQGFDIDYQLLGKGTLSESRYVLGKVILETLKDAILQGDGNILYRKQNLCVDATTEETCNSPAADLVKGQLIKRNKKVQKLQSGFEVKWEANKKYKLGRKQGSISDEVVQNGRCINMGVEASQLPLAGLHSMEESMLESSKCHQFEVGAAENMQKNPETMGNEVKNIIPSQEARDKVTKELLHTGKINRRKMDKVAGQEGKSVKKEHHQVPQGKENIEKKHRDTTDVEQCKRPLSSLFK
ncbi:uncharacterized protein LOC120090455 [Benincasa hispida]|uniref:uncharacterized protein LOC120090455 n=1 Tax=Benincasa hispida TaxID=102211 RepID=UPI00190018D6|nr:uncharacterized protein LOC120090455 [Benincasa hispida]